MKQEVQFLLCFNKSSFSKIEIMNQKVLTCLFLAITFANFAHSRAITSGMNNFQV